MHPILDLVEEAIEKSKQLLSLSEKSEWDQFFDLEDERQGVLKRINTKQIELSISDNSELYQQLTELMALNEQLEEVCSQQRTEIADELRKINQGSKVNKAYTQ